MGTDFEDVIASYHRARASGAFFDSFYELLLQKSPELPPKFASTDFTRQKRMLKESLLAVLCYHQGIPSAADEIQRLGALHGREGINIRPELYALWLDALCTSLAQHDPLFDESLEAKWRALMQEAIERIVELY